LEFLHPRTLDRTVKAACLPDTGDMMCITGQNLTHASRIKKCELVPVTTRVSAANNGRLQLLGGVFLKLSNNGNMVKLLVYIAREAKCLFLSKAACRRLGIIGEEFPKVLACTAVDDNEDNKSSYGCLRRTPAPPLPKLPFPATSAIREFYATSAFNRCSSSSCL
jgi:hypothetical protein